MNVSDSHAHATAPEDFPAAADKRKYKLYSTDKSKELYAKIVALYYNIAEEALNILDEKEEKELLRILGKVRAHIKEIDDR